MWPFPWRKRVKRSSDSTPPRKISKRINQNNTPTRLTTSVAFGGTIRELSAGDDAVGGVAFGGAGNTRSKN
jgi:hypothetical protein